MKDKRYRKRRIKKNSPKEDIILQASDILFTKQGSPPTNTKMIYSGLYECICDDMDSLADYKNIAEDEYKWQIAIIVRYK